MICCVELALLHIILLMNLQSKSEPSPQQIISGDICYFYIIRHTG